MLYDSTKNKCITGEQAGSGEQTGLGESFTNYFESLNNMKNNNSNIIENNMHEDSKEYTYIKESFRNNKPFAGLKSKLMLSSLRNSDKDHM